MIPMEYLLYDYPTSLSSSLSSKKKSPNSRKQDSSSKYNNLEEAKEKEIIRKEEGHGEKSLPSPVIGCYFLTKYRKQQEINDDLTSKKNVGAKEKENYQRRKLNSNHGKKQNSTISNFLYGLPHILHFLFNIYRGEENLPPLPETSQISTSTSHSSFAGHLHKLYRAVEAIVGSSKPIVEKGHRLECCTAVGGDTILNFLTPTSFLHFKSTINGVKYNIHSLKQNGLLEKSKVLPALTPFYKFTLFVYCLVVGPQYDKSTHVLARRIISDALTVFQSNKALCVEVKIGSDDEVDLDMEKEIKRTWSIEELKHQQVDFVKVIKYALMKRISPSLNFFMLIDDNYLDGLTTFTNNINTPQGAAKGIDRFQSFDYKIISVIRNYNLIHKIPYGTCTSFERHPMEALFSGVFFEKKHVQLYYEATMLSILSDLTSINRGSSSSLTNIDQSSDNTPRTEKQNNNNLKQSSQTQSSNNLYKVTAYWPKLNYKYKVSLPNMPSNNNSNRPTSINISNPTLILDDICTFYSKKAIKTSLSGSTICTTIEMLIPALYEKQWNTVSNLFCHLKINDFLLSSSSPDQMIVDDKDNQGRQEGLENSETSDDKNHYFKSYPEEHGILYRGVNYQPLLDYLDILLEVMLFIQYHIFGREISALDYYKSGISHHGTNHQSIHDQSINNINYWFTSLVQTHYNIMKEIEGFLTKTIFYHSDTEALLSPILYKLQANITLSLAYFSSVNASESTSDLLHLKIYFSLPISTNQNIKTNEKGTDIGTFLSILIRESIELKGYIEGLHLSLSWNDRLALIKREVIQMEENALSESKKNIHPSGRWENKIATKVNSDTKAKQMFPRWKDRDEDTGYFSFFYKICDNLIDQINREINVIQIIKDLEIEDEKRNALKGKGFWQSFDITKSFTQNKHRTDEYDKILFGKFDLLPELLIEIVNYFPLRVSTTGVKNALPGSTMLEYDARAIHLMRKGIVKIDSKDYEFDLFETFVKQQNKNQKGGGSMMPLSELICVPGSSAMPNENESNNMAQDFRFASSLFNVVNIQKNVQTFLSEDTIQPLLKGLPIVAFYEIICFQYVTERKLDEALESYFRTCFLSPLYQIPSGLRKYDTGNNLSNKDQRNAQMIKPSQTSQHKNHNPEKQTFNCLSGLTCHLATYGLWQELFSGKGQMYPATSPYNIFIHKTNTEILQLLRERGQMLKLVHIANQNATGENSKDLLQPHQLSHYQGTLFGHPWALTVGNLDMIYKVFLSGRIFDESSFLKTSCHTYINNNKRNHTLHAADDSLPPWASSIKIDFGYRGTPSDIPIQDLGDLFQNFKIGSSAQPPEITNSFNVWRQSLCAHAHSLTQLHRLQFLVYVKPSSSGDASPLLSNFKDTCLWWRGLVYNNAKSIWNKAEKQNMKLKQNKTQQTRNTDHDGKNNSYQISSHFYDHRNVREVEIMGVWVACGEGHENFGGGKVREKILSASQGCKWENSKIRQSLPLDVQVCDFDVSIHLLLCLHIDHPLLGTLHTQNILPEGVKANSSDFEKKSNKMRMLSHDFDGNLSTTLIVPVVVHCNFFLQDFNQQALWGVKEVNDLDYKNSEYLRQLLDPTNSIDIAFECIFDKEESALRYLFAIEGYIPIIKLDKRGTEDLPLDNNVQDRSKLRKSKLTGMAKLYNRWKNKNQVLRQTYLKRGEYLQAIKLLLTECDQFYPLKYLHNLSSCNTIASNLFTAASIRNQDSSAEASLGNNKIDFSFLSWSFRLNSLATAQHLWTLSHGSTILGLKQVVDDRICFPDEDKIKIDQSIVSNWLTIRNLLLLHLYHGQLYHLEGARNVLLFEIRSIDNILGDNQYHHQNNRFFASFDAKPRDLKQKSNTVDQQRISSLLCEKQLSSSDLDINDHYLEKLCALYDVYKMKDYIKTLSESSKLKGISSSLYKINCLVKVLAFSSMEDVKRLGNRLYPNLPSILRA